MAQAVVFKPPVSRICRRGWLNGLRDSEEQALVSPAVSVCDLKGETSVDMVLRVV